MANFNDMSVLADLHSRCVRRSHPAYRGTPRSRAQYRMLARDCETLARQQMGADNRFVLRMLAVPVIAGLLVALWASAASAAEQVRGDSRELGRCVTTEVLVTDQKTGEQHIAVHTVCECSAEHPCTSVSQKR